MQHSNRIKKEIYFLILGPDMEADMVASLKTT